jgi:hypothetical protein
VGLLVGQKYIRHTLLRNNLVLLVMFQIQRHLIFLEQNQEYHQISSLLKQAKIEVILNQYLI